MHAPHQRQLGLAGLAMMNGSRTSGRNAVLRSPRQRQKALEKEGNALVKAAQKRWGKAENMPDHEAGKLQAKLERLRFEYLGY